MNLKASPGTPQVLVVQDVKHATVEFKSGDSHNSGAQSHGGTFGSGHGSSNGSGHGSNYGSGHGSFNGASNTKQAKVSKQ